MKNSVWDPQKKEKLFIPVDVQKNISKFCEMEDEIKRLKKMVKYLAQIFETIESKAQLLKKDLECEIHLLDHSQSIQSIIELAKKGQLPF